MGRRLKCPRLHLAFVAAEGPRRWVAFDATPLVLSVPQPQKRTRRGRGGGHDTLEAQMPGVVRKLMIAEGERVEAGQVLLLLEAMKMEIRVSAPGAGVVEKVLVREGETVGRGQTLVELSATGSPAG
jgi:biotin carboxyl carrier protein